MFSASTRFLTAAGVALAFAALLAAGPAAAQAQAQAAAGPFEGMAGTWSGTGSVTLGSGDKERIRCRLTYLVNDPGDRVEQDLRCASDSYKFDLSADLIYADGFVTGRWNERSRGTSGSISGRARTGYIEALAEASAFSAFFTMTTRGDRHSVKIESKSPEISDVTITLRRTAR